MRLKAIWLLLLIYFTAALSFALYEAMLDPFWVPSSRTVGNLVGAGFATFALAGILPMIGWAFVKFRASSAVVPMVAWLVIGVCLAYLSHVGSRLDRNSKVEKFLNDGGLIGKERQDFMRSAKLGCEQKQRSDPLTAKIGISDAKIVAYCDCYAAGASEALTREELRHIVSNGKPPDTFTEKATTLAQFCATEPLKKKS
jgi:hypothetical protein